MVIKKKCGTGIKIDKQINETILIDQKQAHAYTNNEYFMKPKKKGHFMEKGWSSQQMVMIKYYIHFMQNIEH